MEMREKEEVMFKSEKERDRETPKKDIKGTITLFNFETRALEHWKVCALHDLLCKHVFGAKVKSRVFLILDLQTSH